VAVSEKAGHVSAVQQSFNDGLACESNSDMTSSMVDWESQHREAAPETGFNFQASTQFTSLPSKAAAMVSRALRNFSNA
jgi:hypothetical protein